MRAVTPSEARPGIDPAYYGIEVVDRSANLRRAWSLVRRRWLLFAVTVLVIVGLTALHVFRQTPLYTATANILVNTRELNVVPNDQEQVIPDLPTQQGAVDTEVEIMKSPAVVAQVVRSLNLTRAPDIIGDSYPETRAISEPSAINTVSNNLKFQRSGQTNVIGVSYTSEDPTRAAQIANEISRQYLHFKSGTRTGAALAANQGLGRELASLRGKVEAAEADVARYKAANNLLSSDGVTLTEQEISMYNQQVATAKATLAEEQARLRTARSQLARGSAGDDVGEALNSQVIEQLRSQRAQISTKLADLRARYKPGHPDVLKAQEQLKDIDSEIQGEIRRIVSNLEARVQVAQDRASATMGTVGQARSTLATNNNAAVRLNELERRAEALRSNYAAMLSRYNAVSTQAVVAEPDANVFSPAPVPLKPSHPNKPLSLIIGMLLALVLASGAIWLVETLESGLTTSEDVERRLQLPHVGNVPTIASIAKRADRNIPAEDYVIERPLSLFAESIRSVRQTLLKSPAPRPVQIIGLTSSLPGEGKSTLAVSLTRASALAGSRTILLDGDLRRPSIARLMNLRPQADLVEVLGGAVSLEEAIMEDPASGAFVLPTLSKTFTPNDIFNSANMDKLLSTLRDRFDVIILDTAPALATVDTRVLLERADVIAMLVKWRTTKASIVNAAFKKLHNIDVPLAGIVLTQVDMKTLAKTGYGDVDYAYTSYKSYFDDDA